MCVWMTVHTHTQTVGFTSIARFKFRTKSIFGELCGAPFVSLRFVVFACPSSAYCTAVRFSQTVLVAFFPIFFVHSNGNGIHLIEWSPLKKTRSA